MNVIFDNNGRSGVNGEHSPLDAVVPAMMIDHSFSNEPAVDPVDATKAKLSPPQLLEWTVDDLVMKDITIAQKDADALIADSDLTVLHFKDFGLDFIKKVGKVSPDAFVQMAIQLAYFKIHGKFAPVYESSSTRQFLHGRTETCRSCSVDSTAFLKVCVDKTLSNAEKYKYLQKACKSHVDYITAASNGRGCDRHMLGLRMVIKPDEPTPAIFTDPAYRESMSFRLSTSGLFTSKCIVATGFGAGVVNFYLI